MKQPPPIVQANLEPAFPLRWLVRLYPMSQQLHDAKEGAAQQAGSKLALTGAIFIIPTHAVRPFIRERLHVLEHGGDVDLGDWVGNLDELLGRAHDMPVVHRDEIPPGSIALNFPWRTPPRSEVDRDALRQALKELAVDQT